MDVPSNQQAAILAFPSPHERARPADHDLTVVVPAFNEQQRLPATLLGLKNYLDDWDIAYRVLVVDNGSSDATGQVAERFGRYFSTILETQSGKGAAVRAGMLAATGHVLAFTDADLPYDLAALRRGYEWIRGGACDVVFGARDLDESAMLADRRFTRRLASFVFRQLSHRLVSRTITDTQCGLKIFRRATALELFSRLTTTGFAFDAELVYLAGRWDLACRRVPVTLINEHASTLSVWRETLPMLRDIVRFRWRLRGRELLPATLEHVRRTTDPGRRAAA